MWPWFSRGQGIVTIKAVNGFALLDVVWPCKIGIDWQAVAYWDDYGKYSVIQDGQGLSAHGLH